MSWNFKVLYDRSAINTNFNSASNCYNVALGVELIFVIWTAAWQVLVGHNALMDVMFLYDKFYRPLPGSLFPY